MKVFGVYGFKNSGKTAVVTSIIRELRRRGYKVAAIKHISYADFTIDVPGRDTDLFSKAGARSIGVISEKETSIIYKEKKQLMEMISFFHSDYLVLEGFRQALVPKILTAKNKEELEKDFRKEVFAISGLVANEITEYKGKKAISIGNIEKLVDIIEEKTFEKIPELNCKGCGQTCEEMLYSIVDGEKTIDDCLTIKKDIRIVIEGKELPMNAFVQNIIRNSILGMLSTLNDYKKGTIEIVIDT
ncbi:MAG TPA: molybdopterin-guanine dinucleotide biosynthesis protein B [Candidatus Methanofastidiosa archaeon]|nr:molybdopterin-guanine dinucleotide biosynthesis protein B [Candidatus Methanofastidiosa archaeon]